MDANYWITELGRLYRRSTDAIQNEYDEAVEPLASEFNEALAELKDAFPDHEIISRIEPVEGRTEGTYGSRGKMSVTIPSRRRTEALHEIRSRCEKMANALGYELPDLASGSSSDQMVMVSVDSSQQNTQNVSQSVSVESIQQLVDLDPQVRGNREELKELVEQFDEELQAEDPDSSVLREFLTEAKQYSTSVAAKMAVRALQIGGLAALGL